MEDKHCISKVITYDATMTTLFRWILFSTLVRVAAITLAVVILFMVGESIDKSRYLGQGLDVGLLTEYLILKVPFMISEFMPVIVLIAVAIYILEMSHHHELVALRAAGISFVRLLMPLLSTGALAGLFMFAVGEWVEPVVNKRLNYIEQVHIQKKHNLKQGVQWMSDGNDLLRLMPLTPPYFSVLLIQRDGQGRWQQSLNASKGMYRQGQWHLEDVYVSQRNLDTGFSTQYREHMVIPFSLGPETIAAPSPRDMRWLELYQYERVLAHAGLSSSEYLYQLQRKLAAPLSCLIMVILAYSLCSSMGERTGANTKGIIAVIVIGLTFYVVSSAIRVYVIGEAIPVVFGAWLPNILFLGVAVYLLLAKEGY